MSSGKRYNNANLNSLFERPAEKPSLSGSTSGVMRSGMLILQGHRSQRTRFGSGPAGGKLAIPKPVNLPSLRKEHSGNDPNTQLVPSTSGAGGWAKPEDACGQDSAGGPPRAGSGAWSTGGGTAASPPAQQPPRQAPRPRPQVLGEEEYPTLEAASHLKQPVKGKKADKPATGMGAESRKAPSENVEWADDDRRGYQQTTQRAQRPGWFEDERYAPKESYSGYGGSSWDNDYRRNEYIGRNQDSGPAYGPGHGAYPPPPRMGPMSAYPEGPLPPYHDTHMQGPYPGPSPYSRGIPYPDYMSGYDTYMDTSLFPPPPPPPPRGPRVEGCEEGPNGQDAEQDRDVEREEYEAELRRRVKEMEAKRMMEAESAAGPGQQAEDDKIKLVTQSTPLPQETAARQSSGPEGSHMSARVSSDAVQGDKKIASQSPDSRKADSNAKIQRAAEAAKQAAVAAMSDIPDKECPQAAQRVESVEGDDWSRPTKGRDLDWEAQAEEDDKERDAAAAREKTRHDICVRMRYQTPVLLKQPSQATSGSGAAGHRAQPDEAVARNRSQPTPPHLRTQPVGSQLPPACPGPPPQQGHPGPQARTWAASRRQPQPGVEPATAPGSNQRMGGAGGQAGVPGPWGQRLPASVQEQMDLNSQSSQRDGKVNSRQSNDRHRGERPRSMDEAETRCSPHERHEPCQNRAEHGREDWSGDGSNGDCLQRQDENVRDQGLWSRGQDDGMREQVSRSRRRDREGAHDQDSRPRRQGTAGPNDRDSRPKNARELGSRSRRQGSEGACEQGPRSRRQDENVREQGPRARKDDREGAQVRGSQPQENEGMQDHASRLNTQDAEGPRDKRHNRQDLDCPRDRRSNRQESEGPQDQGTRPRNPRVKKGPKGHDSHGDEGGQDKGQRPDRGEKEMAQGCASADAGARPGSQQNRRQGQQTGRANERRVRGRGGEGPRGVREMANEMAEGGRDGRQHDQEARAPQEEGSGRRDGAQEGRGRGAGIQRRTSEHDQAERGERTDRSDRRERGRATGRGRERQATGQQTGPGLGDGSESRRKRRQKLAVDLPTQSSGTGEDDPQVSPSHLTASLAKEVAQHALPCDEGEGSHSSAVEGNFGNVVPQVSPTLGFDGLGMGTNETLKVSSFSEASGNGSFAGLGGGIGMGPSLGVNALDGASVASCTQVQRSSEPPIQFGQFGGSMNRMLFGMPGPFSAPPGQFGRDVTSGIVNPSPDAVQGRVPAGQIVSSGMEMATTGEGVQCLPQELMAETEFAAGEVGPSGGLVSSAGSHRPMGRTPVSNRGAVLPENLFQGDTDMASGSPTTSSGGNLELSQKGQGRGGRGRGRRGAHKHQGSRGTSRNFRSDGALSEEGRGGQGTQGDGGRGASGSRGRGRGMPSRGRGGRGGGGREQPSSGEPKVDRSKREWVPKAT
eukprot:evm.model.scf_2621.2 EVM.evm.TU.scf_2621.2   scf_2621:10703-18230(+)